METPPTLIDEEGLIRLGFSKEPHPEASRTQVVYVMELHDVDPAEGEWTHLEVEHAGGLDLRCWTMSLRQYRPGPISAPVSKVDLRHGLVYLRDIKRFLGWWKSLNYQPEMAPESVAIHAVKNTCCICGKERCRHLMTEEAPVPVAGKLYIGRTHGNTRILRYGYHRRNNDKIWGELTVIPTSVSWVGWRDHLNFNFLRPEEVASYQPIDLETVKLYEAAIQHAQEEGEPYPQWDSWYINHLQNSWSLKDLIFKEEVRYATIQPADKIAQLLSANTTTTHEVS